MYEAGFRQSERCTNHFEHVLKTPETACSTQLGFTFRHIETIWDGFSEADMSRDTSIWTDLSTGLTWIHRASSAETTLADARTRCLEAAHAAGLNHPEHVVIATLDQVREAQTHGLMEVLPSTSRSIRTWTGTEGTRRPARSSRSAPAAIYKTLYLQAQTALNRSDLFDLEVSDGQEQVNSFGVLCVHQ
jgi:hypothetical protein